MAVTLSRLATQVVDELSESYSGLFTVENKPMFVNAIQSVITDIISTQIPLSRTEPDYERVMLQLYQALSEDPVWYDALLAGTGPLLTRMIASGIAFDQFSIQRALQESFNLTATSENSIFAITRMLGVRPRRKLPARVNVAFTRTINGFYTEIPAYSTFQIDAVSFFNRDKIIFKSPALETSAVLYQGLVVRESIVSIGEAFQTFFIGNGNRTATNDDVIVTIDGEVWKKTTDGPWTLGRNEKVYYESTAANGDIEIRFGNGDYGAVPASGKTIEILWVETLGAAGNLDATNVIIQLISPANSDVFGRTSTSVQGGDDQLSPQIYRKIAPHLRAANRRAVRRSDYRALALEYSGIKDAMFRGAAELAPGRRSMMNVMGVTLLTDTPLQTSQWNSFVTDFTENYSIYRMQFLRIDPIAVIVDIDATIFCRPDASLTDVKSQLTKNIEDFFKPKIGHLGYDVYLSDISDILNGRDPLQPDELLERSVEYCVIRTPSTDVQLPKKTYYCKLGTLNLNMEYTARGGYTGRLDLSSTTGTVA